MSVFRHPIPESDRISRATKIIVAVFFGIVLIAIITSYFREVSNGGSDWKTGDWLINYGSGFVRRGAFGELAIFLSELLSLDLLWTVAMIQSLILFLVFFLVLMIFFRTDRSPVELMILISPAFLLFPFYDSLGAFRKEILAYIPFLLYVSYLQRGELSRYGISLIFVLYALALFSHELAVFVLPFFIIVTFLFYHLKFIRIRQMYILSASFVALAGMAMICSVGFSGSDQSAAICHDLIARGLKPDICTGAGAIYHLNDSYTDGMKCVFDMIAGSSYLWTYFSAMVLSLLPFMFMQSPKISKTTVIYILSVAWLFTLPLYIFATDWGRWIHVFIFFLSTLVLAMTTMGYLKPRRQIPLALIIPYALFWSIPHYSGGGLKFGIFSLF